jgi:hypothetical protein
MSTEKVIKVCHVTETLPIEGLDDPRLIRRVCKAFLRELRAIYARVLPEYRRQFPRAKRPCKTCAFNPSTDRWVGMEKTALQLAKAIETDQPFYCHANMPYMRGYGWIPIKSKLRLCAAWATIMNDAATKQAMHKAVMEVVHHGPKR